MAFFNKVYKKLMGEDEPEAPIAPAANETLEESMEEYVEEPAEPVEPKQNKSIELKIARLSSYGEGITEVADHLIAGRPVVLNLEGASREATRRIIDFFSGVVYTIGGQLKKISNGIYIVTSNNVDVTNQAASVGAAQEKIIGAPETTVSDAGAGAFYGSYESF